MSNEFVDDVLKIFKEKEQSLGDKQNYCCFCGVPITRMTSNDPWPLKKISEGNWCCPACNRNIVIPERMKDMKK